VKKLVGLCLVLLAVLGCDRKPEQEANEAREWLLERVNRDGDINDFSVARPLVGLEEFFEGNDDYGSIGYNFYPDQPAPSEFYALFKGIRDPDRSGYPLRYDVAAGGWTGVTRRFFIGGFLKSIRLRAMRCRMVWGRLVSGGKQDG
jgi:hypothetical protein